MIVIQDYLKCTKMKIKKVDIHAFRLFEYEDVDLSAKKDSRKPANFIAIYAPNGFGKTSFFDSMEFCMTGKIHRLDDKLSENASEDRTHSGKKSFIHNKNLPGEKVFVKMEFDDRPPIERTCNPNEEYQILQGVGENAFFTNAILSQDFFSEFISNKDAKSRFEIFTRRFKETEGLLDYRIWLKEKDKSYGLRINSLDKKIKEKTAQLNQEIEDIDWKAKLSDVLSSLNSVGISVNIKESFSEKYLKELMIQAKIWQEQASKKHEALISLITAYQKVESGTEELTSIYQLPSLVERKNAIQEDVNELLHRIADIKRYTELSKQLIRLQELEVESKEKNDRLEFLIVHYAQFCEIAKELTSKELYVEKQNAQIDEVLKNKDIIIKQLSLLQDELSNLAKKQIAVIEKLKHLHESYKEMSKLRISLDEESKKLAIAQSKKEDLDKEVLSLRSKLSKLHSLYETLCERKVNFTDNLFVKEMKGIVDVLNEIGKIDKEIKDVDNSVAEKKSYLGDIETLVANSRAILSKIEGGVCPLCGYDYHSQETLLKSISTNTIVEKSLQLDIQKRELLVSFSAELNSKKEKLFTDLIATVDEQMQKTEALLKELKINFDKTTKTIYELTIGIEKIQSHLKESYTELADIPEDKIHQVLEADKEMYANSILKKQGCIKLLEEELSKKELQLTEFKKNIEIVYKEISTIKSGDFYIGYVSKLENARLTDETFSQWKELLKEENIKQVKIKAEIQKSNQELAILKEKEVLVERIDILQKQYDERIALMQKIEKERIQILEYLEAECRLDDIHSQSSDQEVISIFEQALKLQKTLKAVQEKRQMTLGNYISVLHLIETFLGNKSIEAELNDLRKQEEKIKHLRVTIKEEIDGIQYYLEKFVKSYFELDLINRLYNAIDPHPDYKEIQFKCDFKLKNPRLKILLSSKEDGKESIVPNLYFSTAQMNILSFCIFLAKALFATDNEGKSMDCIFIDDPIQALDDINILSIIDLLRNVAFSMDKQIVLTTHDRNFFELLQKKVPNTLFNSRFITLPERGKIAYV